MHEQNAETMAQHKHKFALRSYFEEILFTLFPCTPLTSEKNKPKPMNPSKLELLHQHREFIQSSVEVRYIPYYGTEPKQHLRKYVCEGKEMTAQLKILTLTFCSYV